MLGRKGDGIAWWLVLLLVAIIGLVLIALWATGGFGALTEMFWKSKPEESESAEITEFRLKCQAWSAGGSLTKVTVPTTLKEGQCSTADAASCCRTLGYQGWEEGTSTTTIIPPGVGG